MLRALAQAGGGTFEFFDTKSRHTWAEKVRWPPFRDPRRTPACHANACPLAAGGVSGEAHGGSGLHFGSGEVAAVQPNGAPSCSSPQAAARSVRRLPHLGVRLRATLHSGWSNVGVDPHAPPGCWCWLPFTFCSLLQATLFGNLSGKELQTMVSTSELQKTSGTVSRLRSAPLWAS